MFVHSVWSHSPLSVEQASGRVREQFEDFEPATGDGAEFFMIARSEQIEGADFDETWTKPESTFMT